MAEKLAIHAELSHSLVGLLAQLPVLQLVAGS